MRRPSLFADSFHQKVQLVRCTQFQYCLAVTRQKFFHGPQIEKPWSKRLTPGGAAYRRLKAGREENMAPGSYMQVYRKQKNTKSNDDNGSDNQKK